MRISDWSSDVCSSDLPFWLPLWRRRPRGTRSSLPRRALKSRSLRSASPSPSSRGTKSPPGRARSEEHTSELQSLMRISYAVFCLKKKTRNNQTKNQEKTLHYEQLTIVQKKIPQ